jgi:hypothetical protein
MRDVMSTSLILAAIVAHMTLLAPRCISTVISVHNTVLRVSISVIAMWP